MLVNKSKMCIICVCVCVRHLNYAKYMEKKSKGFFQKVTAIKSEWWMGCVTFPVSWQFSEFRLHFIPFLLLLWYCALSPLCPSKKEGQMGSNSTGWLLQMLKLRPCPGCSEWLFLCTDPLCPSWEWLACLRRNGNQGLKAVPPFWTHSCPLWSVLPPHAWVDVSLRPYLCGAWGNSPLHFPKVCF